MARTLPWLKGQPAQERKVTASPQPTKCPRLEVQNDNGEAPPSPAAALPKGNLSSVKRRVRTPSTSPPPEAPTEEFMMPGLENDDIFIMVEDEFLATAQTFTAHLHHAEYVRLKNLTKAQNASAISTISRPVDGRTLMREELRKRKQAGAQSKKVKEGLAGIKSKRPRADSDEEDNEEAEATNDKDPWAGTAIEGLMATIPAKTHISLIGIQGVKSTTRAAAGYRSPAKPTTTRGTAKTFDLNPSSRTQVSSPSPEDSQKLDNLSDSTASDSDDLDAPVTKSKPLFSQRAQLLSSTKTKPYKSSLAAKQTSVTHKPSSLLSPPSHRRRPAFPSSSSPSPPPSHSPPPRYSATKATRLGASKIIKTGNRKKAFKEFDDDIPSMRSSTETAKRIRELQARQEREKEVKRTSLSEIPVFIV